MRTHGIFRKMARRPGTYAFLSATAISVLWYFGMVPDGILETLGVALILVGALDLDLWEATIGVRASLKLRLSLVAGLGGAALAMAHNWGTWWFLITAILSLAILVFGTAYLIGHSNGPHRLTLLARRWLPAWEEDGTNTRWVLGWGLFELSRKEMLEAVLALVLLIPIVIAIFLGIAVEVTLLSGPVGTFLLGGAGVAALAKVESRGEAEASFFESGSEEEALRSGVLEVFIENAYRLPIFLLSLWLGLLGLMMVFRAWGVASTLSADPADFVLVFENGIAILALLGIASVIGLGIYDILRRSKQIAWRLSAHLGLCLQVLAYLFLSRLRIIMGPFTGEIGVMHWGDGRLVLEAFLVPPPLGIIGGMDAAFLLAFLSMLIGLKLFLSGRSVTACRSLMGVPLCLLSIASFAVLIGLIIQPGLGPFVVPVFTIGVYPLSQVSSSVLMGGRLDEDRKDELLDAMAFVVYLIGSFQTMVWLTSGEIVKAGGLVGVIGFMAFVKARPEWVRWPAWIFLGVKPIPGSEGSEETG